MPNPGTETPAFPNLFKAPTLKSSLCAAGGRIAALYVGGGLGAWVSGCAFCLGGSRGGSEGFGFVAEVGVCCPFCCSIRLTGGSGRFLVSIPVVFALYGTGGGAAFLVASCPLCSSDCSACTSSAFDEAPNPLRLGVLQCGTAARPW